MHDFRYVTKKQAQPIKDELYQILYEVQDLIRDKFTFSFTPIGSSSHNMITYDAKSNIGFDFDINIEVNDDNEDFEPKEIRTIIRTAIDRVAPRYGYKSCEDSTRVLTIKKVNTFTSRIIHPISLFFHFNGSLHSHRREDSYRLCVLASGSYYSVNDFCYQNILLKFNAKILP